MVEYLGANLSPPAPGRRYDHGDSESQTYRTAPRIALWNTVRKFIFPINIFYVRGYSFGTLSCFRILRIRGYKGGNMIVIPIVFVKSNYKDSFLPHFGVLRKDIQHFGNIKGPVPRSTGVTGKVLGTCQP